LTKPNLTYPNLNYFIPFPRYPHVRHYFRNLFFTHFLIRPYFDSTFNKADFLEGAKAAVEFVSNCLSSGDLETLEKSEAVSPECLKVKVR
jgi:hypothetical protein